MGGGSNRKGVFILQPFSKSYGELISHLKGNLPMICTQSVRCPNRFLEMHVKLPENLSSAVNWNFIYPLRFVNFISFLAVWLKLGGNFKIMEGVGNP